MRLSPGRVYVCCVTALLASGIVALAFYLNWFHLGIDLPPGDLHGGTVLLYEVDRARTKDPYNPEDLASALRRRIDAADLRNIMVRSVGDERVEIVLPLSGAVPAKEIEDIRTMIAQQGKLEFRILANTHDDNDAITQVREWINDPANGEKLQALNDRGEPPPQPLSPGGGPRFTVVLQGKPHRHTYEWVGVGKQYVHSLRLENTSTSQLKTVATKSYLGKAFDAPEYEFLLYTREIPEPLRTDPHRLAPGDHVLGKKFEFYILTRKQEPNTEVTGEFISSVSRKPGAAGDWQLHFTFDPTGADRFFALTTLNKPDTTGPAFRRQLGIILDGQLQSAPRLHDPIRTGGQITGDFTAKEVDDIVALLRAGALPATLKPQPVSETTIEPTVDYADYRGTILRRAVWAVGVTFVAVLVLLLACIKLIESTTSRTIAEESSGQEAARAPDGAADGSPFSSSTGTQKE
jgi:SecD/SecF fusion protein